MTGFRLHININDKPDDIRFRLYDNGSLVIDDIGEFDFSYTTPDVYEGVHTLTMTYFQEFNPMSESAPQTVFTKNFTLPDLEYTVTVGVLV